MFRLNPFVRVGLCLSAISCAWPVLAVDDDGETMVVTASSVEQNLKDAPASISVITQEDLQRKPVQNLKDVLKEVPGVQLTNEGDNRKGVSIRGLDSSYTLILVDGKRVNSRNAVFRHNDFDLNWIPVDSIERIEVVRGPMSSLYGSDALGGVVNIITKKIGQKWSGTVTVDTTIQEHRDRGDTYNGQFFTSGPLIDGVLGMKAYGSLAKREKDDPQNSTTTIPEKRRVLKDSPAATAMSNLPGHRIKITILLPDTVSTVRIVIPTRWTKTAWNARTTPSAIMGVGITAPAN